MKIRIERISNKSARKIIETHHYTHSYPNSTKVSFGIYYEGKLQGCMCWGIPATQHHYKKFNVDKSELMELLRLWTKDNSPKNLESKSISINIRILKKEMPNLKVLISYADPNVGHNGIVYQASNWRYIGTSGNDGGIKIGNKVYHRRTLNSRYGSSKKDFLEKITGKEVIQVRSRGKHYYVYPLSNEIENKIKPWIKPYPKRDKH